MGLSNKLSTLTVQVTEQTWSIINKQMIKETCAEGTNINCIMCECALAMQNQRNIPWTER